MSFTLLAQLSDLHIVPPGRLLGGRIDTAAGLRAAVATVTALPQRPDAVVLTGDLTDRGQADEYAHLRTLLAPLAGFPVHPLAGNHDERGALRTQLFEQPPADRPGPAPDDVEDAGGFLQYSVAVGTQGLRLVVLDTVEPGRSWGRLCARRLAWLDATLSRWREAGVIVALHHPPFDSGIEMMDGIGLREGRQALAEVLAAHPQVEQLICGHLHRNAFSRLGRVPVSCAPSTAHQIALQLAPQAPGAWTLEPPGLHLHRWAGPGQLVTHAVPTGRFDGPHPFDD